MPVMSVQGTVEGNGKGDPRAGQKGLGKNAGSKTWPKLLVLLHETSFSLFSSSTLSLY